MKANRRNQEKIIVFPDGKRSIKLTAKTLGQGQYGKVLYAHMPNNPDADFAVKVVD
jgi:serine/threonine protein kinase